MGSNLSKKDKEPGSKQDGSVGKTPPEVPVKSLFIYFGTTFVEDINGSVVKILRIT